MRLAFFFVDLFPCLFSVPRYKDTGHAIGGELWKPRYQECCLYMKEFISNAHVEFSDPKSLDILHTIRGGATGSIDEVAVPAMAAALIQQYDVWNKGVCTDSQGRSTGNCCYDCLLPTANKRSRYNGYDSLMTCGHTGEGWCGADQKVPRDLLQLISSADPVSLVLKELAGHSKHVPRDQPTLVYNRTSMQMHTAKVPFKNVHAAYSMKHSSSGTTNDTVTLRLKQLQRTSKGMLLHFFFYLSIHVN